MSDDFEKDWLNNNDDDNEDDDSLDWLNAADDEDKLPSTGELDLELDWMRDSGDDKKPTRDDSRLGVTGQLDWLRATQNQGDSSQNDDEDEFALDWLQEEDDNEDAPKRDPSRTGVTGQLSWLEEQEERFEQQIEEAEAAAVSSVDDELPEWLQDMDTSDTTAPTMDISVPEDDIPDWLKDAEIERPAKAQDEELPEWMQAEDEWLPEDDDTSADEDEEIPGWLQDAETPSPLTTAEVMAISSDHPLDDIPDWLMEADEEEPEEAAQSEIPDWLSSEEDEWEPVDEEEDFLADDEALPDVPDWLQADSLEAEEQAILMEEDAAFDALFGGELESIDEEGELEELLGAAADVVPDFDNMFDDADFESEIQEDKDEFDLLGDLTSQRSGLTGMLGDAGDELDFLMTEDSDSFDLLGQLAGDDEDEFTDTPIADAVADDEDFLSMAAAQKPYSGSIEDDTLHNVQLDDELDLDELFGTVNEELPAPANEADDPFRWFDDDKPVSSAIAEEDLSWLEDIDEEALEAAMPKAAPQQPAASIDDYLASLDDDTFQLPQTGELRAEIDFETLLNEDLFLEDVAQEEAQVQFAPDAPDWLADLAAQTTNEKSVAAAAIVRQQKDRPLDELNDRLLQLRDRGLEFAPAQAAEDEDLKRILPGIKETLPEITFEPTEATAIAPSLQLTMDQRKRADLLREIAGSADEAATEPAEKPRRRLPIIERIGLTAILLLLVALPFFTDALNIGDTPSSLFVPGSPERALFDQIDALQPGDYVLIAADYGATGAAELDTSTEAVLRHALLRGAHPVIVSGNPIGLLRAGTLMDTIAEESNLIVNQDYTIGNYLIADVIGLRNFGENIELYIRADASGESTGLTLDSLDDFATVVVIAESADRLRGWIEQVAPITSTPMLAITGFSAEPLSEPYLSAESLNGYLVGYEDGYTYSRMLNTLISGGSLEIPPTTEAPPPTETPELPTSTPIPTETTVPTVAAATAATVATTVATEDNTGVIVQPEATLELEPSPTREGGEAQIAPSFTPVPSETATLPPSETPLPTDTPLPSATPTPEARQIAIITVQGAVNVRATPSTSGEVVSALQTNNRADIIGQIENELNELWYNIRFIDPFTGQVAEGWVREDLIQVSLAGTELTPVPSPTMQAAEPTPTREGASLKVPPVLKLQEEPTPTREGEVAVPEATLEITPEVTVEITPEVTPEVTLEVVIPTVTPIPATEQAVTEFARAIQPMDTEQHDERWYSMTLGLIGAILVIAGGSIINILRVLRRRN